MKNCIVMLEIETRYQIVHHVHTVSFLVGIADGAAGSSSSTALGNVAGIAEEPLIGGSGRAMIASVVGEPASLSVVASWPWLLGWSGAGDGDSGA